MLKGCTRCKIQTLSVNRWPKISLGQLVHLQFPAAKVNRPILCKNRDNIITNIGLLAVSHYFIFALSNFNSYYPKV